MSNLNLDTVSPSQASKEATINQAIAELEAAMTESVTYDLSANHTALLIDEQRNGRILCTGVPSAGTTLTLVAVKRALIVGNPTGAAGTLTVAMGTTTLLIQPGSNQIIYCDGTTNGMVAIGGSGSGLPVGASDGQLLAQVKGAAAWVSRGDNTGAHAYWQIKVRAVAGPPQRFGVGEVEFRAFSGGPQIAAGGTPTLLPDTYGGRPASNAFDGDIATMAMTNSNIDNGTPAYLKYHFTTAVQVHELCITSTNEGGYSPQNAPATFDVQYSDDDITYTTAWTVTGATWSGTSMVQKFRSPSDFSTVLSNLADVDLATAAPTNGQVLTYNATTKKWSATTVASGGGSTTLAALTDVNVTEGAGIDGKFLKWDNATSKWVPATVSGGGGTTTVSGTIPAYKRWRLSNFYAQQINSSVAMAELQLRATVGGSAQTPTSANAPTSYSGDGPSNAYDGNTGTFWSANDGNFYNYIEYVYTTAVTVAEIAITARNDSYFYQSPLEFDVEASNDGGATYTFIGRCRTGTNYTTGSTQTFAVPTTVQLGVAVSDTFYARAADIVVPTASMFTFAGSGSNGSVTDTTRGMYLKLAATIANAQQAFCYAAMPSTPYTVKMLAHIVGIPGQYNTMGIAFSESSGKHISFNLGGSVDKNSYSIQKFNSLGSFNASTAYYGWASTPSANVPTWLKVQDDGTNLAFFGSTDGEHWFAITSVSRTVFNTPTLIGPILSLGVPDSTGADIGMKVISYQTLAGLV